MIVALWHRWTLDRRYRWLALCLAVIALDLLVARFVLVPFIEAYVGWVREVWE